MTSAINWIQREQDVGINLNAALHTNEPSRFRLLLASLSPHPSDWVDPPQEPDKTTWIPPFMVGVQRPLFASDRDYKREPGKRLRSGYLDWLLTDCLDPEALVGRDGPETLPGVVLDNTPHWLRARDQERSEVKLQESDLVDLLDSIHGQEGAPSH